MKKASICFGLLAVVFAAGCGGAAAETAPVETPVAAPVETETAPVAVAPAPPEQKPIERVKAEPDKRMCSIVDENDGARMVISYEKDWFFYVKPSAEVDCSSVSGDVTVVDGAITIKLKSLIPAEGSDKDIETQLRERAVQHVKAELIEKYRNGDQLKFVLTKVGTAKRNALCVDSDLTLSSGPGKVAACITSKKNVDGEVLIQRVVWAGSALDYDAKETFKQVKEIASSWYRYSDTDGTGKLLTKW